MTKKAAFLAVLSLILVLTAGAVYLFIPKKAAALPDFSPMPMDTAGYNLIGNLPENLGAGGFMAGQNGWLYFANLADGGSLYMCRENGADLTKVTDFPVCNINVLGTSVVFTSLEYYTLEIENGNYYNVEIDPGMYMDKTEHLREATIFSGSNFSFGGKLYAIYGIDSPDGPRFCVIDPDTTYFSPYLDRDGLYAAYVHENQNGLANKINNAKMAVTREGEHILKQFSYGSAIYAQLSDAQGKSRVMRIDAKTLFPVDYINGGGLCRTGNSFVFLGEDGFAYGLDPASGEIKPVSSAPIQGKFKMNQYGEITADTGFGNVIISREQWYRGAGQSIMSRRKSRPITLQNGWYNYFNANRPHNAGGVYFKANDKYYKINDKEMAWSEGWLNVKLDAGPLVSPGDLIVEDAFTPPWIDYSESAEAIDPASDEDFGSERPARLESDNRADAADDAQNALDAAVLLLLADESVADKYTGESVEKLRNRYGGILEASLAGVADGISHELSVRFGAEISPQEMYDTVNIWLENTSYSTGGANVSSNGEEASVTLTAANAVDLSLLYTVIENELSVHTAGNFGLPELSPDEKIALATDLIIEIMQTPSRYGFTDSQPAGSQIYMTYSGCWTAGNPAAIVRGLIRGLDN